MRGLYCTRGSIKSILRPLASSRLDICYSQISLWCHLLLCIGRISSLSFWRLLQHVLKAILGNLIILPMTRWSTSCSVPSTPSKNPCKQEASDQTNSLMSKSWRRASRCIEAGSWGTCWCWHCNTLFYMPVQDLFYICSLLYLPYLSFCQTITCILLPCSNSICRLSSQYEQINVYLKISATTTVFKICQSFTNKRWPC